MNDKWGYDNQLKHIYYSFDTPPFITPTFKLSKNTVRKPHPLANKPIYEYVLCPINKSKYCTICINGDIFSSINTITH